MYANLCAASLLLLSCAIPLKAADNTPTWRSFEIGEVGGIVVRLKVLSPATAADEDWIAIEFQNSGSAPVQVRGARYSIRRKQYRLIDGQPVRAGSLASGNLYDLFPKAWETTPVADIYIQPGVHSVVQHPSRYGTASLGLPSKDGHLVRANFHMSLELEGGQCLELPSEGKSFQFQWLYPDETGFVRMRYRLSRLLETLEPKAHKNHSYILDALLRIPSVAEEIPLQEILAAKDRRKGSFDGRSVLVSYLDRRNSRSGVLKQYNSDRLKRHDFEPLEDLMIPAFWDASFVEPLVVLYERDQKGAILTVLDRHREDWEERQDLASRLSAALLRKSGTALRKKPQDYSPTRNDPPTLKTWSRYAKQLAHTHDIEALPLLSPFLNCKVRVLNPKFLAYMPLDRPPPFRACDVALDGILTILDGDAGEAYRHAGFPGLGIGTIDQITEKRDEMIVVLKKRLAALDITR